MWGDFFVGLVLGVVFAVDLATVIGGSFYILYKLAHRCKGRNDDE